MASVTITDRESLLAAKRFDSRISEVERAIASVEYHREVASRSARARYENELHDIERIYKIELRSAARVIDS